MGFSQQQSYKNPGTRGVFVAIINEIVVSLGKNDSVKSVDAKLVINRTEGVKLEMILLH